MPVIEQPFEQRARQWQRRRDAVGRAQARYLYALALIGAFYLALSVRIFTGAAEPDEALALPILGLRISAFTIWATAPIVLGFMLLATLGTFFALTRAERGMEFTGPVGEEHDTTPTALDFVVYATTGSSALLTSLAFLVYPIAVAVFYAEAVWIWLRVQSSALAIPARGPLVIIGAALLVAASPGFVILCWRKALKLKRGVGEWRQGRRAAKAGKT